MQRKAIYAGSFDPFTLGHLDVVQRVAKSFERVIVLVGYNKKKNSWLSVADRMELVEAATQHLPNVIVESWSGLTVDFARKYPQSILVRSLRSAADLEWESAMAWGNSTQFSEVETFFLLAQPQWQHLSSSLVRELWHHRGDYQAMLPLSVYKFLKKMELNP